jgi:hypothetical protein
MEKIKNLIAGLEIIDQKTYLNSKGVEQGKEITLQKKEGFYARKFALLLDASGQAASYTLYEYKHGLPLLRVARGTINGGECVSVNLKNKLGCLKDQPSKVCSYAFQTWIKRVTQQRIIAILQLIERNSIDQNKVESLIAVLPKINEITYQLSWRNRTEQLRKLSKLFYN